MIAGAVIINADISARHKAERELHESLSQLRALTGRLMRAQDDERRRIAQMLHETTAQDLAALKMQLASLGSVGIRVVRSGCPGAEGKHGSSLNDRCRAWNVVISAPPAVP